MIFDLQGQTLLYRGLDENLYTYLTHNSQTNQLRYNQRFLTDFLFKYIQIAYLITIEL